MTDAEHFRGRSRRSLRSNPIEVKYQYFMGHEFTDGGPLSNLTAQVEFIATVAAINNGGVGPESSEIYFLTEARGNKFIWIILMLLCFLYSLCVHIS